MQKSELNSYINKLQDLITQRKSNGSSQASSQQVA